MVSWVGLSLWHELAIRKSLFLWQTLRVECLKYDFSLKTLLQQGISEPVYCGECIYTFNRIVGSQFKTITKLYKNSGL